MDGWALLTLPATQLDLILFRDESSILARVAFDAATAPDLPQQIRIP